MKRKSVLLVAALVVLSLGLMEYPAIRSLVSRVRDKTGAAEANDEPVDLAGYAERSANYAAMGHTKNLVFLGDSRIEWGDWPELLGRTDISNRGIAGDTLPGILRRMRSSVPDDESVCIIQAGVNDLVKGARASVVVAGYRELAQYLLKEKKARVILTSIILVNEERTRLNQLIMECNRELSRLAASEGMEWLDLGPGLSPSGYLSPEYSEDGVHLNANGYAQFSRALAPLLPPAR
ncbi:MAG: GDSL-type esterase/lipase family protein [Verrucomicrobiota bacterium]|nr:GDSL-type esterase/lipase family protein [Verrucomicrobiota bacterium]